MSSFYDQRQGNINNGYLTIDSSIAGIEPDFNPFEDTGADTQSLDSLSSYIPLHTMNNSRASLSQFEDDDIVAIPGTNTTPLLNNHLRLGSLSGESARSNRTTRNNVWVTAWNRLISMVLRKSNRSIVLPISEETSDINSASKPRYIYPGMPNKSNVTNFISNAKYNGFSFFPIILYEQFKFFFNLYFLLVALSQAIPVLRIGYLSSYVVPLAFVLCVTMSKEAIDDIQRRRRDAEQNNEMYEVLGSPVPVPARLIQVGDLVRLGKGKRIPADMVILQSSEKSGESFIKTDQLDGETDWKLRLAVPACQKSDDQALQKVHVTVDPPNKLIDFFQGKLTFDLANYPLTVDNTLWANTVLASGTAVGCVIYIGKDTRQSMNMSVPTVKTGLLELEINSLSKILCLSVFLLSFGLVVLHGMGKDWYVDVMKYLILFSTIIPVSLRVNLDLGKSVYAYQIEHDKSIEDTIVRTSTIPEDLGRIEYLLSDKTGTLTQNDMELKKLHLGTVSYAGDSMDIVKDYVINSGKQKEAGKSRRDMSQRVYDLISTLALCHNVTPTYEDNELTYQAASPDEIAIVKYTESVGLSLVSRDRTSETLSLNGQHLSYDILQVFPFNSDVKRMGVIVFDQQKQEYWFLQKGADTVMRTIVAHNTWLDEEVSNMAREGLRTLVIGRKKITEAEYEQFKTKYQEASLLMSNRELIMQRIISQFLEQDLELLGLTGVEDKLQDNVKSSIELLRNAGIKIWMLTGDKVETARCVAVSAKLISRGQYVHTVTKLSPTGANAINELEVLKTNKTGCLLIDGESLAVYLKYYKQEFFNIVIHLPAVIACRCTPQQKADVALLIRELTKKRVCCIGDGGNDVNMIQSADVGVGIVGKEGKQASLAADFSITQFCHLTKLLLWHGRNSYKRSAKLAQFVIHRGLIISICQVIFSVSSLFEPLALYQGWLMVGYATLYTMAPVFSMVLDTDVNEKLANLYPELYKELKQGRSLSWLSFFVWCFVSCFQGSAIQLISQFFTYKNETEFKTMVGLSFSALIVNELIMVAIEINTWNKTMMLSEIITFLIYVVSVPWLGDYFNLKYVASVSFLWQVVVILAVSITPIWFLRTLYRRLNPPNYAKVQS